MLEKIKNKKIFFKFFSYFSFFFFLLTPAYADYSDLITGVPSHITSTGRQNDPYIKNGFLPVTYYNGWNGKVVDPTGAVDSTEAIQQAIKDARSYQLVAFFPNQANGQRGIYKISKTLNCEEVNAASGSNDGVQSNILVGSNTNGIRPLIKLASGAAGFQNPTRPWPMIKYWTRPQYYQTKVQDFIDRGFINYMDEFFLNSKGNGFDQVLKGIDLDLGANAGAMGVYFGNAQGSSVEDVSINATGAFAGLWDTPTYAGFINVNITGGRYAVYTNTGSFIDPFDPNPNVPPEKADGFYYAKYAGHSKFIGCKFINQTSAVFKITTGSVANPIALIGFQLKSTAGIPLNEGEVGASRGGFTLIDGLIETGGGQFINRTSGQGVYMRDVYTKGVSSIVSGWSIGNVTAWTRVQEYSIPSALHENLINGVNGTGEIRTKIEGLSHIENQLIESLVNKHIWNFNTFPHFEESGVLNAKTLGAVGNAVADDTSALQNAINQAASQNKTLLIPKGVYLVSSTLTLRANSRVIGASKSNTIIRPIGTWKPAAEAIIVNTDDSADGTAILSDILISNHGSDRNNNGILDTYVGDNGTEQYDQFRFTPLQWRIGRNSIVRNVVSGTAPEWVKIADLRSDYARYRVNGHGGGRWYFPLGRVAGGAEGVWHVGMLIENTNELMRVYGLNANNGQDIDSILDIRNSDNKFIYYPAVEAGRTFIRITDSNNVASFTSWKNNLPSTNTTRGLIEIFNSTNVVVAVGSTQKSPATYENHLLERSGSNTYKITTKDVQLFKRGDAEYATIGNSDTQSPAVPLGLAVK